MQVYPNRFFDTDKGTLKFCYLVFGDEPQQKLDIIDNLRQRAKEQGFDERQSLVADSQFDWSVLIEASQSLSLFSSRQMIELELPTGKPGTEGGKVLTQMANDASPDTLLVIHGPKAGRDVQNAKWFKSLDKQGIFVPCFPLEGRQLQQWITQRMSASGLAHTPDIIKLLSDYCEGNLLAARQEIEKLTLLYPQGDITLKQVEGALVDQSRFNVFQLIDLLLTGEIQKAVKVLCRLESEGIEPNIILWALCREQQTLSHIQFAREQGQPLANVWNELRIWKSRQNLYQAAINRLSTYHIAQMQNKLAEADSLFKSEQIEKPYVMLCHLCLLFMPAALDNIALDLSF
ncbi:DNA polymerase III subunit delta [Alteromonadaceae bacterium M269]|nr:DNA polymerase III subunit delta [Alteromonadaceae bacterium M269]